MNKYKIQVCSSVFADSFHYEVEAKTADAACRKAISLAKKEIIDSLGTDDVYSYEHDACLNDDDGPIEGSRCVICGKVANAGKWLEQVTGERVFYNYCKEHYGK